MSDSTEYHVTLYDTLITDFKCDSCKKICKKLYIYSLIHRKRITSYTICSDCHNDSINTAQKIFNKPIASVRRPINRRYKVQ